MNNLPKVVTQQHRGRASNPRLLDRKSDALPLSHRATLATSLGELTKTSSHHAMLRVRQQSASIVQYMIHRWQSSVITYFRLDLPLHINKFCSLCSGHPRWL